MNRQNIMNKELEDIVKKYDENEKVAVIEKEEKAAVFVVDMINDFTFTSDFKNPLAVNVIPGIYGLLKKASEAGKNIFHINESHERDSVEFLTFPTHGIRGTDGAEIVDKLKEVPFDRIFYKNSTNGMHNEELKKWFEENPEVKIVIATGVLADMCLLQFAIGAKTYCNEINRDVKFIVPLNLVETSDYPGHNRDLFYYMALEFMSQAGIEIVKEINFER